MNLRDFEYFSFLGDVLSFTLVAKKFNVSQPSVSYAIKRLEEYYGCNLIEKSSLHRSILLTREGQILKKQLTHILEEFKIIEKAIEHAKQQKVYVGFPTLIKTRVFSKIFKSEDNVDLISNFELISGSSTDLLTKLLSGQLELSLLGSVTPIERPDLNVKLLYKYEFKIYVSEENPLAKKSQITFEEALAYPFILLEDGLSHTQAFDHLNDKHQGKAKVLLHFSDINTIGQLVKSNVGITLMTPYLPFQNMKGMVEISLVPEDREMFYVQYAFLKKSIINENFSKLIKILDNLSMQGGLLY
jgi:DNA-binding transcriptional LysR family regulator